MGGGKWKKDVLHLVVNILGSVSLYLGGCLSLDCPSCDKALLF